MLGNVRDFKLRQGMGIRGVRHLGKSEGWCLRPARHDDNGVHPDLINALRTNLDLPHPDRGTLPNPARANVERA